MATERRIEMCCGGGSKSLTVKHYLEDIVVAEGGNVHLECEISGHPLGGQIWYKDGVELRFNNRVRSTNENKWYRLNIDPVVANDQGLYTIVLQNDDSCVFSSACLYVGPPIGRNAVLYTGPCTEGSLTVVQSLINVTVHTEQNIDLRVEFSQKAISSDDTILWYKGNKLIAPNERTEINNTPTVSKLHIESANLTDSGIYTVVSKTKMGIISSTALVEVVNVDMGKYNSKMPCVCEHLPDTVEVNDDEEVRLICKAKFNANTVVKWFINNRILDNRLQVTEIFSCNYVGLKISPKNHIVGGKYKVVLENPLSGTTDASECNVYPNPVTVSRPAFVLPKKPLISAIAIYGSEVTFNCSFECFESRFFFVVWYIGAIRVERSNTRFNNNLGALTTVCNRGDVVIAYFTVHIETPQEFTDSFARSQKYNEPPGVDYYLRSYVVCKNSEYLLRIKKVEPYMAGEIICELRHFYYDHDSLLVGETRCTLSIVPLEFLDNEQKTASLEQTCHPTIHSLIPIKDERRLSTYKNSSSSRPFVNTTLDETTHVKKRSKTTLIELTYSRLEEDIFYYLDVTKRAPSMAAAEVTIRDSPMEGRLEHVRVFTLEWSEPDIKTRTWYAIDIEQSGKYVEAGISSNPVFHLRDPVEGRDLRIRIRTVLPLEGTKDANICIAPALPLQNVAERSCKLKSMAIYEESYRDVGYEIGFGAFGRVMLTRGKSGDHYASKYIRTISEKKKQNARREFNIMRLLQHSKVIELIDAFSNDDGFIFVMEYLWGGELFSRIVEEDHIQEMDVVTYVRQICEALLYLHSLRIAHMDLKPENIMCLNPNSKQVKLVDFGLARVLKWGEVTRVIYGTKDYVAPEVLEFEPLTVACDMWSLGVITYLMLSGVMPFRGENWVQLSANITKANYNFDETAFKDISDLGKDFISSLLVYRPEKRMTASGALSHKWIVTGPPEGTRARHMKKTKDNLKSYLASKAKWQNEGSEASWRVPSERAGNVMIAAHRLRTQVNHRSSMERTSSGT